jgi:hypothetical protein
MFFASNRISIPCYPETICHAFFAVESCMHHKIYASGIHTMRVDLGWDRNRMFSVQKELVYFSMVFSLLFFFLFFFFSSQANNAI